MSEDLRENVERWTLAEAKLRDTIRDKRQKLARAEGKVELLRVQLRGLQGECEHRLKSEVYCCGKPDGVRCRICGVMW